MPAFMSPYCWCLLALSSIIWHILAFLKNNSNGHEHEVKKPSFVKLRGVGKWQKKRKEGKKCLNCNVIISARAPRQISHVQKHLFYLVIDSSVILANKVARF